MSEEVVKRPTYGERWLQTIYSLHFGFRMNPATYVKEVHEAAAYYTPPAHELKQESREMVPCVICAKHKVCSEECERGYTQAHWDVFDVLWRSCRNPDYDSDAMRWQIKDVLKPHLLEVSNV